jgi:repressor LexA
MPRIRGDSMPHPGILDPAYDVVQNPPPARNGQIGAALVDGEEATVKRFEKNDIGVVLHPENDSYEPIVFSDGGVSILGVVVAVLRRID